MDTNMELRRLKREADVLDRRLTRAEGIGDRIAIRWLRRRWLNAVNALIAEYDRLVSR